jgi:hypothetical protein
LDCERITNFFALYGAYKCDACKEKKNLCLL